MCAIWANLLSHGACQVVEWTGDLVADGAKNVAGSALQSAAESAGQSAGQLITVSLGWWTFQSSVDFGSPAIAKIQQYTMPLSVIMLMSGVILAAAKTAIARRGEPLVNLAINIVTFLVVATAGVGLLAALQAGGDAFSAWIITDAGADFGQRFAQAATASYTGAFGIILISLFCILISFVQWLLMLFRSAALVLLAGALPFAAAASTVQGRTDSTKRVFTWSIAILIYKPTGALIYVAGFVTISEGGSLLVMLEGVVIIFMAIIALPALVRLFSWISAPMPGGGGGALAAATGIAGLFLARRPGGGGQPGGQAEGWGDNQGPGTQGPPDGGPGDQGPGEVGSQAGQEVLAHTQSVGGGPPGIGAGRDIPMGTAGSESAGGEAGPNSRSDDVPTAPFPAPGTGGTAGAEAETAAATAATGGAAAAADAPSSGGQAPTETLAAEADHTDEPSS
ncbi:MULTISPECIES: hypothetical protein [unclassified Amycolatopsis]|uniref:hypothetical protein n=1 Tax=unclassified Amycolatopsis TaxID=2618356 RepID=UPI002876FF61|nr:MULTISPECIES: hypothetical protein [unclassified Amycolatopsis]MDS0140556.1 hypothetical protein [Amycolatopsis sp. 505]MDS0149206.1 hypothetical protein [Amycolatopsis sp. CM201R]